MHRGGLRLLICACLCSAASVGADAPILVLNSGGHEAAVMSVLFSSDGKYLYSAGEDKVVRIWDVSTGEIVKSIRGQISEGHEGKIYTMALSPDDRYLAVAGVMTLSNKSYIRVHDLKNKGQVIGLLDGGPRAAIARLAYSPNGKYIASTSDRSVRVYDLARGGQARVLEGHQDIVQSVAFSPDASRLVSASQDRTLRLWDLTNGKSDVMSGHRDKVVSAIFSPDGRYIVSSSEDRQIRLWDGKSGKFHKVLATQGTGVANLCFSQDGKKLLTSSSPDGAAQFVAQIYSVPDGRLEQTFRNHDGPIMATVLSSAGIAATAGGLRNQIQIWNSVSGQLIRTLVGHGEPVFRVAFADNGESVAYGNSPDGSLEKVFYLKDGSTYRPELGGTIARTGGRFHSEADSSGGLTAKAMNGPGGEPLMILEVRGPAGPPVRIKRDGYSGYRHSAYTFTPDGKYIISGGFGGVLSLFRASDGEKVRDFTGHTGDILSVAVSSDNKTFVSGANDQTFRIWDIGSSYPILNVFVADDDQWIAWTPQGYYTTNGMADKYVGWHLNRGPDKTALWFSAAQYLAEFYKPKVVASYLDTREIRSATRASREETVRSPLTVAEKMGPLVAIKTPASESESSITGNTLRLVATAQSETAPITSVKVLINKALVVERLLSNPSNTARFDEDIQLEPGKANRVEVVFSNGKETTDWCKVVTGGTSGGDTRPDLYVLAIGLSNYKDDSMKLNFAVADAEAVTKAFGAQKGIAFKDVKVHLLTDGQATKESILEGLGWLRAEGSSSDYRIIFLSGHGDIANDRYFLWCYPYDKKSRVPEVMNITGDEIMSMVMQMKGRVVLLVDTCHSAAIAGAGMRGSRPDPDIVPFFKRQEIAGTSVFTFASSGRTENSQEHSEWGHGAFTRALLDVFEGKATNLGRVVKTVQLGRWLEQRVPELTKNTQNARTISIPAGAEGFDLFYVQRQ